MLYQKHPDLKQYDEFMLKYSKYDKDGNVLEVFEREDVNSPWKNITNKVKAAQELAQLRRDLDKFRIKLQKEREKSLKNEG